MSAEVVDQQARHRFSKRFEQAHAVRGEQRMQRIAYRRIVDRVLDTIRRACTDRGNPDREVHPHRLQHMLLAAVDTDNRLTDEFLDKNDVHPPGPRAGRGRIGWDSGARRAGSGETGKANGIDTVHDVLHRSAANNGQTS